MPGSDAGVQSRPKFFFSLRVNSMQRLSPHEERKPASCYFKAIAMHFVRYFKASCYFKARSRFQLQGLSLGVGCRDKMWPTMEVDLTMSRGE